MNFWQKKSQDKVSLRLYPGNAIDMSLSTRALQRWWQCEKNLFFYFRLGKMLGHFALQWRGPLLAFSLPPGRSTSVLGPLFLVQPYWGVNVSTGDTLVLGSSSRSALGEVVKLGSCSRNALGDEAVLGYSPPVTILEKDNFHKFFNSLQGKHSCFAISIDRRAGADPCLPLFPL